MDLVVPESVMLALPERVRQEIEKLALRYPRIEEVRLHSGRRVTLTVSGRNLPTSAVLSPAEMEKILSSLCSGSVYAFRDSISEGYLALKGGIRVGICGRAVTSGGRISGVYDVDTLVIRIPHRSPMLGREIKTLISDMSYTRGVLIYSPPGVGKTTLLRSLAIMLSSGADAKRVSVVDTRGELSYSLESPNLCLDLLTGYPKHIGIALAVRSLGSEAIICDEIGSAAEAESIRDAHNAGVPLIASAHAASVKELLGRTGLGVLHRAGCFGAYVGIRRRGDFAFDYDVCMREEADVDYLFTRP